MAPRPWTRPGPLLAAAVPYAALAAAYSFNIKNTPRQCEDLELDITGTGSPPYSALIIPTGPTPLANLVEARKITNVSFNGTNTTATFQLKFPENSQFVVVDTYARHLLLVSSNSNHVSDSTGFGTGGTSAIATTLSGVDGCFDNTTSVQPAFLFHTQPDGILLTCSASRIWWLPGDVQGDTSFQGVIPGGESFQIPVGTLTNVTGTGTGFDWTPAIRSGTNLLLVGGDSRGLGSAGSNAYTLQSGSSVSCVNGTSPSSTPGSPAGGSYPTSTDGSGINTGSSSSSSKTNVGAIVGGVIGGVVGAITLGLVLLFAVRRQRFHNKGTKERPVDLLQDQDNEGAAGDGRPPEYYRPEPFLLPDPTVASTVHDDAGRPSADHRQSYLSQSSTSETGGAAGVLRPPPSTAPSSNTRKSAAPPTFRPVNIIQHDDAGPSEPPPPPAEEPETIELPPAYTNIRRNEVPSPKDEDDEATGGAGATGATTQVPQAAA